MGVFSAIAVILGLAAAGGVAARALKQPVILGYIAAGMLVAAWRWSAGQTGNFVEIMGQVGVTLLLFLAGMELPVAELKKLGRVAVITGLGQSAVTSAAGYFLALALGWGSNLAVFIGLGLANGSTILMVKLLTERGDLQSLSGKIAVGYLLVQDFLAVGVLVMLSAVTAGRPDVLSVGWVVVKAVILVMGSLWLAQKGIGRITGFLAKSTELLFIVALGWCMIVAAAVASPWIGFSVEIGGFLAGLVLANTIEQTQIAARVRPVRDFFLTWFFVALGAGVQWAGGGHLWATAVVLAGFVMLVNPVIVMLWLGIQGYKKRVAFLAALASTSVSEFSLIVAATAVSLGAAAGELVTVLTLVAIMTMVGETYIMAHADEIYRKLAPWLKFAELRKIKNGETEEPEWKDHIVLFGHNRIGKVLRPVLEKLGLVVVVDFNPDVVDELREKGVKAIFGDISDPELYEELALPRSRMIISTVPDVNDSLRLLGAARRWKDKPTLILTAVDDADAVRLYEAGASYVLLPHSVGGEYMGEMLSQAAEKVAERVVRYGKKHWERIKKK